MHRNNYTLEISKQYLRISYFTSIHVDVLDLTSLEKWVMLGLALSKPYE